MRSVTVRGFPFRCIWLVRRWFAKSIGRTTSNISKTHTKEAVHVEATLFCPSVRAWNQAFHTASVQLRSGCYSSYSPIRCWNCRHRLPFMQTGCGILYNVKMHSTILEQRQRWRWCKHNVRMVFKSYMICSTHHHANCIEAAFSYERWWWSWCCYVPHLSVGTACNQSPIVCDWWMLPYDYVDANIRFDSISISTNTCVCHIIIFITSCVQSCALSNLAGRWSCLRPIVCVDGVWLACYSYLEGGSMCEMCSQVRNVGRNRGDIEKIII